ncbi:MAG TPA: phosphotransferase [Candidatus Dormibacteraeota bacterium]|nr:phosphotransferase [Candidatus Dormibacteraeota bacterium]
MEPRSKSTMRLPPAVRAAALAALGGARFQAELAWMSWAGTVWRLDGASDSVYVKRAGHLENERERTAWLAGRLPVPEVLGLFHGFGDDWLLTRAIRGVPLSDRSLGWEPERVARFLGEVLRDIHAVDAAGCPFGEPGKGHVLIHGDYCLPNVLVEDGRLSALIDLGGAGLGNPEDDLAAGVWTLQYNFGPGLARDFLDAYGWPPMSDRAIERLRRRYAR